MLEKSVLLIRGVVKVTYVNTLAVSFQVSEAH